MRPSPCLATRFHQDKLHCFPLSESSILFLDPESHVFSYDLDERCFVTMPSLHARKEDALTVAIPSGSGGDGSIYIMEKILRPVKSFQFEALFSGEHEHHMYPWRTWKFADLPPPPYVLEEGYKPETILSCAVVDGAICISTVHHGTWSQVSDWFLPFFGRAEYVPEVGLWFGVSANNYHLLYAADLCAVLRGQPPGQSFIWGDTHVPDEWHHGLLNPSQAVSLGSGRFFHTSFFQTVARNPYMDEIPGAGGGQEFAIFTGLEVLDNGNGNGKRSLRMIKYKSRSCNNSNFIESLL